MSTLVQANGSNGQVAAVTNGAVLDPQQGKTFAEQVQVALSALGEIVGTSVTTAKEKNVASRQVAVLEDMLAKVLGARESADQAIGFFQGHLEAEGHAQDAGAGNNNYFRPSA